MATTSFLLVSFSSAVWMSILGKDAILFFFLPIEQLLIFVLVFIFVVETEDVLVTT